jgi:hypothetical protein
MDMVGDEGQLYTIEGIAAAILMVLTAYIILNSAYIITPGDTHISDMQLEQLGNDVLRMMDTRTFFDANAPGIYAQKQSDLEVWLSDPHPELKQDIFKDQFRLYGNDERLQMSAVFYYWDEDSNTLKPVPFATTPSTGREHSITVTRWVYLDNPGWDPGPENSQTVLLEVRLWRD